MAISVDGKVNEMSFLFNSICFFSMLPATDLASETRFWVLVFFCLFVSRASPEPF